MTIPPISVATVQHRPMILPLEKIIEREKEQDNEKGKANNSRYMMRQFGFPSNCDLSLVYITTACGILAPLGDFINAC
jgi:hypothetical protein